MLVEEDFLSHEKAQELLTATNANDQLTDHARAGFLEQELEDLATLKEDFDKVAEARSKKLVEAHERFGALVEKVPGSLSSIADGHPWDLCPSPNNLTVTSCRRPSMSYLSIRMEGSILTSDTLERLERDDLPGQNANDFGILRLPRIDCLRLGGFESIVVHL